MLITYQNYSFLALHYKHILLYESVNAAVWSMSEVLINQSLINCFILCTRAYFAKSEFKIGMNKNKIEFFLYETNLLQLK